MTWTVDEIPDGYKWTVIIDGYIRTGTVATWAAAHRAIAQAEQVLETFDDPPLRKP